MAITVLNNISDLTAEQALSSTQASLQKTLTQLSTGLKINSGSDDAAGLAIANGLTANIAALTQSQQNVANGIGLLQTTDGALSQVTNLLNRAVTIATEGSTGGISTSQYAALNTEFTSIQDEINQIGAATNFNGENVFSNNTVTSYTSSQAALTGTSTLAANENITISDTATGGTFVFNTGTGSTVGALNTAIDAAAGSTLSAGVTGDVTSGSEVIAGGTGGLTVSTTSSELGTFVATDDTGGSGTVYVGDGITTSPADTEITATIAPLSAALLQITANGLTSATASQASLAAITKAVTVISAERGTIGAAVNRVNAESSVIGDQITNLQAAVNVVENADIGTTVANLTQFNVLESTGIAALQQANQAQQNVLKLVQ